jgi:hypothetical protein
MPADRSIGRWVAHRYRVFGRCFRSDITSFSGAGHPLRREWSLFTWSGQVDRIPLQQALAGLLLTAAAVIICSSTDEGSVMTGEMAPRWTRRDVGSLGPA